MQLKDKPELLAPAGTVEAVRAAFDAEADAVYVGGKQLNMRQHRQSYNLTEEQLTEAIAYAHDNNKKLYFTLNSLIQDCQLGVLRDTLKMLGKIGPDAIIVQDLAAASLAREICVHIPLHASTMMNVHNLETALTLKMMGFKRIISSRDIPIHEIRRIAEKSGLEMECFVHGDMCITHSSLCYASGIMFGESSNCGKCMKPCRWNWKLISENNNVNVSGPSEGYLLARKDLCLFQHIPTLIQNSIMSFKIEGRMRTAEFTAELVRAYRRAIDEYWNDPVNYATSAAQMERLLASRVREFTTALTFTNSGLDGVDVTGNREPRFFSHAANEPFLSTEKESEISIPSSIPELIVHVSDKSSASIALDNGADGIYLNCQGYTHHAGKMDDAWIKDFIIEAGDKNTRVAMMMPYVTDERDMSEWKDRLAGLRAIKKLSVGVSNLGSLSMVKNLGFKGIVVDFPMNISNSISADELSTLGASRITASVELSLETLVEFTRNCRLPVEVIGQGPLLAMLMEHCVIASSSGAAPNDICSMHCRKDNFGLQDELGNKFPLVCDRRCRNHLFTSSDICILPRLKYLSAAGISGIRIEAQLDNPEVAGRVITVYRDALDSLREGEGIELSTCVEMLEKATGRIMSDGALTE